MVVYLFTVLGPRGTTSNAVPVLVAIQIETSCSSPRGTWCIDVPVGTLPVLWVGLRIVVLVPQKWSNVIFMPWPEWWPTREFHRLDVCLSEDLQAVFFPADAQTLSAGNLIELTGILRGNPCVMSMHEEFKRLWATGIPFSFYQFLSIIDNDKLCAQEI